MALERDTYIQAIKDLLSRDPTKIRDANRVLYRAVAGDDGADEPSDTEADLVLAEAAS